MGLLAFLRRDSSLRLTSRTNTTLSVTVPPNNPNFSSVALTAHTLTPQHVASDLGTSIADGLSQNEAGRRLETYGENLLTDSGGVSTLKILTGQLGETWLTGS